MKIRVKTTMAWFRRPDTYDYRFSMEQPEPSTVIGFLAALCGIDIYPPYPKDTRSKNDCNKRTKAEWSGNTVKIELEPEIKWTVSDIKPTKPVTKSVILRSLAKQGTQKKEVIRSPKRQEVLLNESFYYEFEFNVEGTTDIIKDALEKPKHKYGTLSVGESHVMVVDVKILDEDLILDLKDLL